MTSAVVQIIPEATSSCATAAATPPKTDKVLADMRADWQAVARYTVYRSEYPPLRQQPDRDLHTDVGYDEAQRLRVLEEVALTLEPGYPAGRMCRPLISLRLENPEATNVAYLALRAERERRESALYA